jgi:hypothetical protein
LTAQWLNTIGLALGMVCVVILFIWGPPQPDFDEGVAIGLELDTVLKDGKTVVEKDADVRRLKRWHTVMSRIGLGLIGVGFFAQLIATWR